MERKGLPAAEALALREEIEATPGTKIVGRLSASPGGSPIIGYWVAYRQPEGSGTFTNRRVWVYSRQEWGRIARQVLAHWDELLPRATSDAPTLLPYETGEAITLGQRTALAHPAQALETAIARVCQQQGWAEGSEEANVFAFLADAAYHGRRRALHPEEYQEGDA